MVSRLLTAHGPAPSGAKDADLTDRQRILGSYQEDGVSKPISCALYRFVWRVWAQCATEKEKARFALDAREIIHSARRIDAETGGDLARLKPLADEARRFVHEIPERIPRNGFPNIEELEYDTPLTAEEIEERVMRELRRSKLLEWFELAGGVDE